ncbi:MAG: class I SAM-dependent methyltransferase [Ignavibacteriaceae bacterium]
MGIYSDKILPFFYDFSMGREYINEGRKRLLSKVEGEVLEIGFGTGLNLSFYPDSIKKITTVDKNPGMSKYALKKIKNSSLIVEINVLNSEELPFENNSFNSVVSTYTLCSIKNVESALMEIIRVLKPDGKFFFLEHGLADNPKLQKWQHRLNKFQNIWSDGCNLNRDIKKLISNTGFTFKELNTYYQKEDQSILSFMYEGIAIKGDTIA